MDVFRERMSKAPGYAKASKAAYAKLFRAVLELPEGRPLLFQCSQGKVRIAGRREMLSGDPEVAQEMDKYLTAFEQVNALTMINALEWLKEQLRECEGLHQA